LPLHILRTSRPTIILCRSLRLLEKLISNNISTSTTDAVAALLLLIAHRTGRLWWNYDGKI
jgi:hypothetical protein